MALLIFLKQSQVIWIIINVQALSLWQRFLPWWDRPLSLKCPGPDGFTLEYYLHFWNLLVLLFVSVYNDSLKRSSLSESMRLNVTRLLYTKKGDIMELKNWHPIPLLNVDYNIISKVLTLHLSHIMACLIDPHQTCSLAGRLISSNLIWLRDALVIDIKLTLSSVGLYCIALVWTLNLTCWAFNNKMLTSLVLSWSMASCIWPFRLFLWHSRPFSWPVIAYKMDGRLVEAVISKKWCHKRWFKATEQNVRLPHTLERTSDLCPSYIIVKELPHNLITWSQQRYILARGKTARIIKKFQEK